MTGRLVNVLRVIGRYSDRSKVTDRYNNESRVKDNREAAIMYSTGSNMAGGNANQVNVAGPAGKAWVATPAAGAVQAVLTGAAAGGELKIRP